ncbi:hypothetical protein TraAM80_02886 [Trypanosoma rangeli]|uniref:Uncharacterized protein n=1 Tax=Trypanosoma rangeli TaxID=5698 RepID=A0A3R7KK71_TRYRA|nr:uncharacterized protein TraAM80_02886 [Trypanosoma rangeli]RNF08129.1 hypothetical protein TraAM80_02886 [Trypanosoma rangeli]|eukprot:RNF08129.1 hypothetical protein TraAM80_02886 [Trypanosoma rangeli]
MLQPLEDTYVEYLESILHGADVDMGVVKETLASLGLDEKSINNVVGGDFHVCPASTSSAFSSSPDRASERQWQASTEETSTMSTQSDTLWRGDALPRGAVGGPEEQQIQGTAPPTSSSSSSSSSSPPSSLGSRIESSLARRGHLLCHGPDALSCKAEAVSELPGKVWDDPILTPERRDSYKEHLEALEKLLGVVWRPVACEGDGDDDVPLQIRSFLCRERLQNSILGQYKASGMALAPQWKKNPRQRRETRHGYKRLLAGHGVNTVAKCNGHLQCVRHCGSLLGGRALPQAGSRWQCEFCVSLEDTSALPAGVDQVRQPQFTSAAIGNACGVKMRPQAVNTVGCGRIRTKALATTLSYREDRVKKALAYRDGWSACGYV